MFRSFHFLLAITSIAGLLLTACTGAPGKKGIVSEEQLENLPFQLDDVLDSCLVISHRVEDFSTWKAAFDLAEPVREKYGIHTEMVLQGYDDSAQAMVFARVDDVSSARFYVTSENLKRSMKAAGVEGKMDLYWLKHHLTADVVTQRKCIVYMSFRVLDYKKWLTAFLKDYEDDPEKDFDVLHVFQSVDNKDMVSMIFAADDPRFIEKMESNSNFRMKMIASGVVSYPSTYLLREVPI